MRILWISVKKQNLKEICFIFYILHYISFHVVHTFLQPPNFPQMQQQNITYSNSILKYK